MPSHISEAFLVARSKYKNILRNVSLAGGGGEIPRDLAPGARSRGGGRNPWDTGSNPPLEVG